MLSPIRFSAAFPLGAIFQLCFLAIVLATVLLPSKITLLSNELMEHGTFLKSIKNEERYIDEVNAYKRAKLLYIDDFLKVGKNAQPTDADISLAFEMLDYRKEYELPTMVSTERSIEEILLIDEAVGGRLLDCRKIRLELKDCDGLINYRLK